MTIDRKVLNNMWKKISENKSHKPIYDKHMDNECISLCDALNSIPGVQTFGSCCGHGMRIFGIWLTCETVLPLYVIARATDRRYGGPAIPELFPFGEWVLEVQDSDTLQYAVTFYLHSPFMPNGNYDLGTLVKESKEIADNIEELIKMMKEE